MAAQIAPRRMEYPRIGDFRRVVPPGLKEIGDTPMMNASEGCGSGRQGSQSASRRRGPKHPLRRVRGAEALPHGHVAEKELRHASASPCGAAAQLELPTSDRFGRRQSIGGSGGVCRSAEGHGRWRRLRSNGGSVGLGPHGSVSRSTVRVVSVAGAGHTRRTICKITQAGPRPRGAGSVFSAPTPWRCAISRRALEATRPRDHPAAGSTNRSALLASAAPRAAGLKDSGDLPMMYGVGWLRSSNGRDANRTAVHRRAGGSRKGTEALDDDLPWCFSREGALASHNVAVRYDFSIRVVDR